VRLARQTEWTSPEAVTNVWETRDRLLLEHLKKLAAQIRSKELLPPEQLEEQLLRLLTSGLMLLEQHHTNKRGQCKFCGWPEWTWRLWWRRPRCTVYMGLGFVMMQPLNEAMRRWLKYDQT
jgi:hypothetical protein